MLSFRLKIILSKLFKEGISFFYIYFAVVVYFSTLLNFQLLNHFYSILDNSENVSFIFRLTPPLVLFSFFSCLFVIFSFKYLYKPFIAFLIITDSLAEIFAYKYGTIFDYDMMINLLSTNIAEAKSYVNLHTIVLWAIFGILPAMLVLTIKIRWPDNVLKGILSRGAIVIGSMALLVAMAIPYYQNYASIARNNHTLRKELAPYNYVYYGYKAIKNTYFPTVINFEKLADDSVIDNPEERPELFVVVVGETARAQNFKHNGYQRDTTPYTGNLENFTKFSSVSSCGTATAVSVPCMFSIMDRDEYDETKAHNSSSLADIVNYAGYDVVWFDNDGGCKGVCDRIPHENIDVKSMAFKDVCNGDTCYDEVLVKKLQEQLSIASSKNKSTVVFLHLIGSHGPTYYERVPADKKIFQPSCDRSDIENCSVEQIVNSYDNTIVYTDYVLSKIVETLKPYSNDFGTAMFYISDHGESLGEYGLFLHGVPYSVAPDYQKEVPMMTWFSSSFIQDHRMDLNCLNSIARNTNFSQDNIFDSLLGILDINTEVYDINKDLFIQCRDWNKTIGVVRPDSAKNPDKSMS